MRMPSKKSAGLVQEEDEGVTIRVSRFLSRIAITTLVLGYFSTTVQANPLPSITLLLHDDVAVDLPPVITCPSNQTIDSSISVDYPGPNATAVDDNDPNPTVVQSPTILQSGTTTTITATATDNLNQSSQCTFNVLVTTTLVCQPGQQPSSSIANTCEACPANTVSSGGTNACEACDVGFQANLNQSVCEINGGPSGTYLGCFQWTIGINDLQTINQPGMTPSTCVSHCTGFGLAFGAVRDQTICGCGNNAVQLGSAPPNSCQPCLSSLSQECGSETEISVYSTGEVP